MAKVKLNVVIDPNVKAFLEYYKETTKIRISPMIEMAIKEKYSKEYEEYLKNREVDCNA